MSNHQSNIKHRCVDWQWFANQWIWSSEGSAVNINSRSPFLAVCLFPECSERGRIFVSKEEIKQHVYKHTKGSGKPFVCIHPYCYTWFGHRASALRHEKCRENGYTFHCTCMRSFDRKDALKAHVAICQWKKTSTLNDRELEYQSSITPPHPTSQYLELQTFMTAAGSRQLANADTMLHWS